MAKRRMLSIPIVETDKFYRLTAAAQAFYVHLNLNSDDDGVVDKVNLVMTQMRLKRKHYQELVDLGYIIELEEGLIVITHWHQHNQIRKERYTKGEHYERLSTLSLQENGRFFKPSEAILGDKCAPQDSIGKDSIVKESIAKVSTDKGSIAEVIEEKERENTLSLSYLQSSTHVDSASQNNKQEDVCSVNPDLTHKTDSNLVSIALRNAIALYCMKKYQTIDIADFLQYCNSRNWVSDDGESMMDNYIKYVDLWMSKK